jgi:hypothetical protein
MSVQQYGIADIGREFQKYGLTVKEHPEFGGVGGHAPNSYHYYGEAIDVTDWRPDLAPEYKGGEPKDWRVRTANLIQRARQSRLFNETLGPGDKGHDTHAHLALKDTVQATPQLLQWVATGSYETPDGSTTTQMPLQQKDSPLVGSKVSELDAKIKNTAKEEKTYADRFLSSFVLDNLMPKASSFKPQSSSAAEMLQSAFKAPKFMT